MRWIVGAGLGATALIAASVVALACGSSSDDGAAPGGGAGTDAATDGSGTNPEDAQADGSNNGDSFCSAWTTPSLLDDPPAFEPVPDQPAYSVQPIQNLSSVAIDDLGTALAVWSVPRAGTYCGGNWYGLVYASRRPLGGAWSTAVPVGGDGPVLGGNQGSLVVRPEIALAPDGNGFIVSRLINYCDSATVGMRTGYTATRITPSGIGASTEIVHFSYPPGGIGAATTDQDGATLVPADPPALAMGRDGSALLVFGASKGGVNLGANFALRFDPTKNAWDEKVTRLEAFRAPNPALDGITFAAGAANTLNAIAAGPSGSFLVAWLSGTGKAYAAWYSPGDGWGSATELGDAFVCGGNCSHAFSVYANLIDALVDADGNAFVAWRKTEEITSITDPLLVAHYTKAGGWEAPLTVPPGLPRSAKPAGLRLAPTAVAGGVTLAWQELGQLPPGVVIPTLQLQSSELVGGAWSTPTLITNGVADPICMAADETGKQFIAYRGGDESGPNLSTRFFTPGVGWSAPSTIANPAISAPKFIRLLQTDDIDATKTGRCAAFNHAGQSVVAWGQLVPPPPSPPDGETKHQFWATTCP